MQIGLVEQFFLLRAADTQLSVCPFLFSARGLGLFIACSFPRAPFCLDLPPFSSALRPIPGAGNHPAALRSGPGA